MDRRPIKYNPSGKYNLDFIVWNNEWERVGEIEAKLENGELFLMKKKLKELEDIWKLKKIYLL